VQCADPANATAGCASGTCGIGACDAGFGDCDNDASDGCESEFATDEANCGGCGVMCGNGKACIDGTCACATHAIKATLENARVTFPPTGTDVGSGNFTLEFWVKPHDEYPTEGDASVVFQGNENHGINTVVCRYSLSTHRVSCWTYGNSGNSPIVSSSPLAVGEWGHIAFVRSGLTEALFTNGSLTESVDTSIVTLVAMSNFAIGEPNGYPQQSAAPMFYGPFRFSKSARYAVNFVPVKGWAVDADTVAQWLVSTPFDGSTLIDEAGGNNNGSHIRGFIAAECGPSP
jgi:hypothetical protein